MEATESAEANTPTLPRWIVFDEVSIVTLQKKIDKHNAGSDKFVVGKRAIQYPGITEGISPLMESHLNLIKALTWKDLRESNSTDRPGYMIVDTQPIDGNAYIYFPIISTGDSLMHVDKRDEIIRQANEIIRNTGGNNFIPDPGNAKK